MLCDYGCGDYWHSEEMTGSSKEDHEKERTDHFKEFGYKILIVWENELKNRNKIQNKILNFWRIRNYERYYNSSPSQ